MTANRAKSTTRRPANALKHGAFSETAILPGEDPRDFEQLFSALVEEWMPVGPTEEDAVLTIAKCLWRKRRVQTYLGAKVVMRMLDPNHPSFDENAGFRGMATAMALRPQVFDQALSRCSGPLREHFAKKYPPENYQSDLEWGAAVREELERLVEEKLEGPPDPEPPLDVKLVRAADVLGEDLFKNELVADERIDAMLDRAIKRLVQTKAMKQMLANSSYDGGHQPRVIQGNKSKGSSPTRKC